MNSYCKVFAVPEKIKIGDLKIGMHINSYKCGCTLTVTHIKKVYKRTELTCRYKGKYCSVGHPEMQSFATWTDPSTKRITVYPGPKEIT